MALDYVNVGISIAIFIIYLVIIFLSIDIKRKLDRESGRAFIYLIIAILFLAFRRLQQLFIASKIVNPVPYSAETITIIFAFFLFLAVLNFHKSLKKVEERNDILFPQTRN